jgi:hypothetical protein
VCLKHASEALPVPFFLHANLCVGRWTCQGRQEMAPGARDEAQTSCVVRVSSLGTGCDFLEKEIAGRRGPPERKPPPRLLGRLLRSLLASSERISHVLTGGEGLWIGKWPIKRHLRTIRPQSRGVKKLY